jgi:hypothetical protein
MLLSAGYRSQKVLGRAEFDVIAVAEEIKRTKKRR